MATLVTFHAHPDDEAISCGGTMAKAAADGHRVVLVFATKGEHGEVAEDILSPGESLWERRVQEVDAAAKILGVARTEFLGYVDSGMIGTPENDAPAAFWRADVDEAAERLARILSEEKADVLTVYDGNGGYGHPDHIQVHRVGILAGRLAGTPKVYEAVVGRDEVQRSMRAMVDAGVELPFDPAEFEMGVPDDTITTRVDVLEYFAQKRAAMAAHASQIPETSFFLTVPEDLAREGFGNESFILRDAPDGIQESSLFEGPSSPE